MAGLPTALPINAALLAFRGKGRPAGLDLRGMLVIGAADALEGSCPNGSCLLKLGPLNGASRGIVTPSAAEDTGALGLLEGRG